MRTKKKASILTKMDYDDDSVGSWTSALSKDKRDPSFHGSSLPNLSDSEDINRGRNAINEQEKLVGRETKAIGRLRKIVFGVITLVAVVGSLGAFFLVEDEAKRSGQANVRELVHLYFQQSRQLTLT